MHSEEASEVWVLGVVAGLAMQADGRTRACAWRAVRAVRTVVHETLLWNFLSLLIFFPTTTKRAQDTTLTRRLYAQHNLADHIGAVR